MRLRIVGSMLAAAAIVGSSQLPIVSASQATIAPPVSADASARAATSLWQQAVDAQVIPGGTTYYVFTTSLSSANEVPPTPSTATGFAIAAISVDLKTLVYVASSTMTEVAAGHFHRGAAGANGPVVYPFQIPASGIISGRLPFNEADWNDFRNGGFYGNLHSATYPGGEIRGQMNSIGLFSVPDLGSAAPVTPVAPPVLPPVVPAVTLPQP